MRSRMVGPTVLADIDKGALPLLRLALKRAGAPLNIRFAHTEVVAIKKLEPTLLICDIDYLVSDQIEMLRQLRFVLPSCIIAVYTSEAIIAWGRRCHAAGASAVFSKKSTELQVAAGLRFALRTGCFTDPRLVD